MIEIRFHGRGGQGAVVASEILASALFSEGKSVQTFPEFGVERRGAPVQAFLRIDDKPINIRCKVYTPDHIIVLDPVLIESVNVTQGLKPGGWILVNTEKNPDELGFPNNFKVATVDASAIAIKYRLGPKTAPIVNTAILGAFSKITDIVSLELVLEKIKEYVPVNIEGNLNATKDAYATVKCEA